MRIVTAALIGIVLAAFAGCAKSEPDLGTGSESVAGSVATNGVPVWTFEVGGGYFFSCADECGAPNCNCIGNRCVGNPIGQACAPEGAECNVVSGKSSYRTLECEEPETSPSQVWTRVTTSSCLDECGTTNCNCITDRCVGNPQGQACSPSGDSCNVVSGLSFTLLNCR